MLYFILQILFVVLYNRNSQYRDNHINYVNQENNELYRYNQSNYTSTIKKGFEDCAIIPLRLMPKRK